MAVAVFAQSNGGRDRRVPVVHTPRTKRPVPAGSVGECCVIAFFLWFGVRQFRKTEKSFADLI